MAVQLSSYCWLRNNYLAGSLEDKTKERYCFNEELSQKDRRTLKFLIDELDKLKEDSHFQQGRPMIAEHILLQNIVELKDVTSNPELAAAYLQGIHKIMEKYWVKIELYRQLGNCFDELGIEPPTDVAEAIKYATDKIQFNRDASLNRMSWLTIKDHRTRGISR